MPEDKVFSPRFLSYRQHGLHFFLRGLAFLPDKVLDYFAESFGFSQSDYPAADAHMRMILGLTNRVKSPVRVDNIVF